jgi:hypothetical protein
VNYDFGIGHASLFWRIMISELLIASMFLPIPVSELTAATCFEQFRFRNQNWQTLSWSFFFASSPNRASTSERAK